MLHAYHVRHIIMAGFNEKHACTVSIHYQCAAPVSDIMAFMQYLSSIVDDVSDCEDELLYGRLTGGQCEFEPPGNDYTKLENL